MATDDSDVPDTGAVFTFGKSRFADNTANKFWIRNDKVIQVSCGDDHTAFVTETGRNFTFGANEWGQLGLGHTKSTNKPGSIKALKHEGVVMVGCGRLHTIAYTRNDRLYGFGAGGEGQLGVAGTQAYETPQEIESLAGVKVKMISCGTEHSAVLTADGNLYMFGSGSDGQLGLGDNTETDIPRPLSVGVPIKHVSCGYYHTAIVTDEGKLYTFGENEFGKLGLNDDNLSFSKVPQHVSLVKERVQRASCGNSHTAAVTDSGSVYTWGDGSSGQLGHGPSILELSIPQKIMRLGRKKCRDVVCGESHTAVITENGSLYMFGDGRHGKLCQGDESFSNLFQPTKVKRFKGFHVEQVSCGGCQTIVRARRKDKSNGEVSSDSEGETDPLKMSGQMKKGLMAAALCNDQGVDSVDLGGSLGGSFDGSARGRRRQKETSPLPPLARTLPPLGSAKAGALPSLSSTVPGGHGTKLDQSLIPNIRHEQNEVHEEMITKKEVKVVEAAPRLNRFTKTKDADPLESTHFSASKSVRELKPLLDVANGEADEEESETRPEAEGVDEIDSGTPGKSKENEKLISEKETEIKAAKSDSNENIGNAQLGVTFTVKKPENRDSGADSEEDSGEDDEDEDDDDEEEEEEEDNVDKENSVDVKAVKRNNRFVDILQASRPTPVPRARTQARQALEDEEDDGSEDEDDDEDEDEDEDEDDSEPEEQPAKTIQTKKTTNLDNDKGSDEDEDNEDRTKMARKAKEKMTTSSAKQTKAQDDDDDDDDEDDEEDDEDEDDDDDDENEDKNEEDRMPTKQNENSPKKEADKETKDKSPEVKKKKKGKKEKETEEDGENIDEKKENGEDGEKKEDEEDVEESEGARQPGEPKAWQFWKKKTPASKVAKSSTSVSSEEKPTNQNRSKTCSIL